MIASIRQGSLQVIVCSCVGTDGGRWRRRGRGRGRGREHDVHAALLRYPCLISVLDFSELRARYLSLYPRAPSPQLLDWHLRVAKIISSMKHLEFEASERTIHLFESRKIARSTFRCNPALCVCVCVYVRACVACACVSEKDGQTDGRTDRQTMRICVHARQSFVHPSLPRPRWSSAPLPSHKVSGCHGHQLRVDG